MSGGSNQHAVNLQGIVKENFVFLLKNYLAVCKINMLMIKKWIIGFLVLLLVITGLIYIFIPAIIQLSETATLKFPRKGLERTLYNDDNWAKWWPASSSVETGGSAKPALALEGNEYKIREKKLTSLLIDVKNEHSLIKTNFNLFYISNDSVLIQWEGLLPASYNPLIRVKKYFEAKKIKKEMALVLKGIQSYFTGTQNVYGSDIKEILVVDSVLIYTDKTVKGYPNTESIYQLIDVLKKHISETGNKEAGFPMLNVLTEDSINFTVKIAIPVTYETAATKTILFKRMMKQGKILFTEIKGGPNRVNEAFRQMEAYYEDYDRRAPAIPFLSLVTDRRKEIDTSKWITRIYYPVR